MKIQNLFARYCRPTTGHSPLTAVLLLMVLAMTATAQLNYDTAWTYVYDGGSVLDGFYDIKSLSNGVCVGVYGDTSTGGTRTLLTKIDSTGQILLQRLYCFCRLIFEPVKQPVCS